jgi:toxin ParE1/3/4
MNTYSFSEEALQDLDQLCEYIAQTDQRAASKIFDAIRKRARLLAQFPNMGKSYDEIARGLRGAPVNDYIIFYYPRADGIDITRIISGHRDIESLFADN